jgi:hypothetical protein
MRLLVAHHITTVLSGGAILGLRGQSEQLALPHGHHAAIILLGAFADRMSDRSVVRAVRVPSSWYLSVFVLY